MAKILKKRYFASPSFRGSAKRLSSIRNKKKSDNQVSSDSSVMSFSTQASTLSRMSLPSFRRSKRLSRKKGTSSSVSLCELKDNSPKEEKTLAIVTVKEAEVEEAEVEEATPTPKATDAKEIFFEHMSTAADAVIDLVQSLSGEDASLKLTLFRVYQERMPRSKERIKFLTLRPYIQMKNQALKPFIREMTRLPLVFTRNPPMMRFRKRKA